MSKKASNKNSSLNKVVGTSKKGPPSKTQTVSKKEADDMISALTATINAITSDTKDTKVDVMTKESFMEDWKAMEKGWETLGSNYWKSYVTYAQPFSDKSALIEEKKSNIVIWIVTIINFLKQQGFHPKMVRLNPKLFHDTNLTLYVKYDSNHIMFGDVQLIQDADVDGIEIPL